MHTPSADSLSQLFDSIEINSTALAVCTLRHPWGITFPGTSAAILHAVTAGEAHFEFSDGGKYHLRAGDVLLSTRFVKGAMMSREDVPLVALERLWADRGFTHWSPGRSTPTPNILEYGGRGRRTIILGVMFDVGEPWRTNLLKRLPTYIHLRRRENVLAPWLEAALSGIAKENVRQPLGYGPIARRIAEIVLFSCIRSYLVSLNHSEPPWFSALTDDRLARALTAIRTRPERGWTLSALAREAGMSRSSFASRFHSVLAISPVKYLRDVRMRHAAERLAAGHLSIKDAARCTGYASSSAFSVAFKRKFGKAPQLYRRGTD